MKRVYLDHNATTPVAPEVLAAMLPYLTEEFGNARSRAIEENVAPVVSITYGLGCDGKSTAADSPSSS